MFEKMVQCDTVCDTMTVKSIGETVQSVLNIAISQKRITLGFSESIKLLSTTPEEAQFCFLAEPKRGDSATHMHEVLLQAFCYEHGIYIIKVDSGRKLAHILGTLNTDETCVLIRKSNTLATTSTPSTYPTSQTDYSQSTFKPLSNASETCVGSSSTSSSKVPAVTANNANVKLMGANHEEDVLVKFCESYWDNVDYCIVQLPES